MRQIRTIRPPAGAIDEPHGPPDAHDLGLAHDLEVLRMARRRRMLGWLAGTGALGAVGLLGCGGGGGDDSSSSASSTSTTTSGTSTSASASSTSSSSATSSSACSVIPEETAGPYPGDGSNSVSGSVANALAQSGIVRSDIRASFGSSSGTAEGLALTVTLQLVDTNGACASLAGYAIYLWHCDREGRYSMYSSGVTNQNYLRGVQQTDADGRVSFSTIFPGCYSGRMPHIHFEIYRSTATASSYTQKLRTSQLAFPVDVCNTVYRSTDGYESSVSNFAAISFASDNVFSDGVSTQMTTLAGNITDGYTATLEVGIAA